MADAHATGAESEHKHPNYMTVFWWLLAFTIIEVVLGWCAAYLKSWRFAYVSTLLIVAIIKAGLVAAYFMHLKMERRLLTAIVLFPLLLLLILTLALLPDASSFIWSSMPAKK